MHFSWRHALLGWLAALGLGAVLTLACVILSAVLASAGSGSATSLFAGLGYALLSLVASFPLGTILGAAQSHQPHLWILPNVAVLGLAPALVLGFVGEAGATSQPSDPRPYFRMDDGRD